MKEYKFKLDKHLIRDFFAPIRNKTDIIRLLMRTTKLMLLGDCIPKDECSGEIILVVSKMSRLFFFSEKKKFSIAFPFTVTENEGCFEFSSTTMEYIDNRITSEVVSILSQEKIFHSNCALEFIDPILTFAELEKSFWPFLLSLFMYEDGYIRYDHDKKNKNGDLHPLNHLDLFYSSRSTCKIGMREILTQDHMMDFLKTETNCRYIEKYA